MEPGFVPGAPGTVERDRARPCPALARVLVQELMDKLTTRPRRPRRALSGAPLGIAIALAALAAVASPGIALAWTNYSFSSSSESEMLTLINQARASNGLAALQVGSTLHDVARWRSKDMYDRDYFSHDIPNPPGGSVFNELNRRGVCYTVAGENIGINDYPDDVATQTLFNGWMNSAGHRALILSPNFTRIGIGAFKGTGSTYPNHLWTAVFTHPCSTAPKPTPKPTPKPPKPTPHPTDDNSGPAPRPAPTAEPTPEPTPEITPDPEDLLPTAGHNALWLDWMQDDGFDAGVLSEPGGSAAPGAIESPGGDGTTVADDGSLQVIEPLPTSGLLDAIVGDVVASFLGK